MKKLLLVCCAFLMIASIAMAGTRPQASAQQGVRQGDGPGRDVVMSDLPDMSRADMAAAGGKQAPFPRNPNMSAAQYQALKAAASRSGISTRPQDAARLLGAPKNPATDSLSAATPGATTPAVFRNFLAQAEGCAGTSWVPSDMGLAVSAAYIVQTVNECIAVYNKTGGLVNGPKDLCGIFGLPQGAGQVGCFDPRALYDAQANKFVVTASYYDLNNNGWLLIASAANPTLTWHSHKIAFGATLVDYPTVGQTAYLNNTSNSVITVCANLFENNGGFTDECIFLPKKGVYGTLGGFPTWFNFTLGGVLQNSMQPVDSYELSDNPRAQYVINSVNDGGGICNAGGETGLLIWAFSGNTAGQSHASPWFTGCGSTSFYSFPGAADNAGFCSACIETLDNRISAKTFYSQGEIYPSIDTNNGATSAVLGWRVHPYLDVNGQGCTGVVNCPSITAVNIENEWCYDCGGGNRLEAYFGAQAPDPENDWALFATFSSRSDFFNDSPGQFYVTNRVSNLTPFIDSGTFYCGPVANAYGSASNVGRWGDYAAAAPDDPGGSPAKVAATWGSGMYVNGTGTWGTCIAGVHPQNGP